MISQIPLCGLPDLTVYSIICFEMRTDRYRKQEIEARKRRRRNALLVVILLLIAAVTAEVWTLLTMTSIDQRFTRNVERGLYAGWSLDADETQLQTDGRITDTSFIDAEYDAVSEYMNRKYKDDELADLAKEYTSALKSCRSAARQFDPASDFNKFWAAFSEPYGRRVRALYKLYRGEYGLDLSSDAYSEETEYLLSQGWLLETLSGLTFHNTDRDGINTFFASIRNDSGRDIDYLNIDVELLDKAGKSVETSSIYLTDIPAGGVIPLRFISTSDKVVSYRISSETASFKKSAETGQ